METEKQPVKLNIRSEEIEAILGKTPNWIMKGGITVLFVLFLILIIGSSFFRYPDIINAKISISSEYPSVALVTKVSGRLVRLDVKENQEVEQYQLLGILENPASVEDVIRLNSWLEKNGNYELMNPNDSILKEELQLGKIMSGFLDFKSALINYETFVELNYHPLNIATLREQIIHTNEYITHTKSQIDILRHELELTERDYKRDSLLYEKKIISPLEAEQAKSILLQKKFTLEGNLATLASSYTQLSQLKQSLLELELDYHKQRQGYLDNIQNRAETLKDKIKQWDKQYVLRSPYKGRISFPAFWTLNQFIPQGEIFANIIPSKEGIFIGKLELPIMKSGKVKVGQSVNIKLDNYPYMEYGILKGMIRTISTVPTKDAYKVEVEFPEKLKTSYQLELPFSPELTGTAEIITEDYNLLQRIFLPVKSLFKNHSSF